MENTLLSKERRMRVLSVGFVATFVLYGLVSMVAEPMRVLGATSDQEEAIVAITLASAIGMNCDADGGGAGSGETLTLTAITSEGDTGELNGSATVGTNAVLCNVRTNNSAGYDLAWQIATGSGGASTGYMISQFEDVIDFFPSTNESTPTAWNATTVPATASAFGGRLAEASSGHSLSPVTGGWGSDAASNEKWLKVSTGSTTVIARENSATQADGSNNYIGFRVEVGSSKIQPTGTYQSTVQFTASVQ